jgi:hypothetical protein
MDTINKRDTERERETGIDMRKTNKEKTHEHELHKEFKKLKKLKTRRRRSNVLFVFDLWVFSLVVISSLERFADRFLNSLIIVTVVLSELVFMRNIIF